MTEEAYLARSLVDEVFDQVKHWYSHSSGTPAKSERIPIYLMLHTHEYLHIYAKQVGLPTINFLKLTDELQEAIHCK